MRQPKLPEEPESELCKPGAHLRLTPSLLQLQENATGSIALMIEKAITTKGC